MSTHPALTGLVVRLEDVDIDELVGVGEVLVQEGFRNLSLPVGSGAFEEFASIYGARARVGVHRMREEGDVARAVDGGATFAFFDVVDAGALHAASEAGLATYAQAMTPTEVRDVLALPVAGAMLYPADVVGHIMASRLEVLGLVDRVIPAGGLGAFAAGEWMKAGAPAACVDATLLSDALHGGDLGALRDRCASFIKVQDKHSPR